MSSVVVNISGSSSTSNTFIPASITWPCFGEEITLPANILMYDAAQTDLVFHLALALTVRFPTYKFFFRIFLECARASFHRSTACKTGGGSLID